METNKPFKTISLEERLAQSVMGKFKPTEQVVNEKSPIKLKDQQTYSDKKAAQLKLRKDGLEKTSPILKQMVRTLQEPVYPTINAFQLGDITKRKLPEPYTSFPNTIRLGDRLQQPLDGKATHLAKYFLSDTYSGIVKATPFTTSPLASRIDIDPYGFNNKKVSTFYQKPDPNKGSPVLRGLIEPTNSTDTQSRGIVIKPVIGQSINAFLQGVVITDSGLGSITNPKHSVNDLVILTRQGASLTNNILISRTVVKTAILTEDINQGTVNVKKVIDVRDNAILQGMLLKDGEISSSITIPVKPLPIPQNRNGVARIPLEAPAIFEQLPLKIKQNTSPEINDSGQPLLPTSAYISIGPILQNLVSSTQTLQANIVGYDAVGSPFDFAPTYYSPTLSVIAYDTDQLLARFTPVLKHGTVSVQPFNIDVVQGEDGLTAAQIDVQDLRPTPQKGPYKQLSNTGWPFGFLPAEGQANAQPTLTSFSNVDSDLFTGVSNVRQATWRNIIKALAKGTPLDVGRLVRFPGPGQGSLSQYKALTYGQIQSAATKAAANSGESAAAASGPNPQIGRGNKGYVVQNVPDNRGKDFITIKVSSETQGKSVNLKAYLNSFADSVAASWNDVTHVGRQDTLKQFKGVTRTVSFAVSVPSFSKVDLPTNMKKVQDIISITSVGKYQGNYLIGPLCRLTLGGFFKNVYVVFDGVKVDFDTAESTWDIDSGLPHLLKLSFNATLLGDVDGRGLSADTSRYYSYSG
jgi:hypothetical protein